MVAYSFRPRFVAAIKIGLGLPVQIEDRDPESTTMLLPKRQTIRAVGDKRHAQPGEKIQLYTGMRTKHCRKIGEAVCVSVQAIEFNVNQHSMPIMLDGALMVGGRRFRFSQED